MTRRELEHLVQDLLEGVLRRGDAAALEAELRGNPEARGVYRHHVLLHNALQLRAEGLHLTYAVPMEEAIARGRRRLMRRATLAAAAVMAAAAVVMGLIVVLEPAPVLTFAVAPGTEVRLSHAADGAEVPEGPRLEVGSRLELRRGVVELDFASGVRGIVRAPASVTLQAGDRLSLHEGTGWFEVPGKAAGFQVETPELLVTDLGTEFGILSRPDLPDEVHVFKGSVEIVAHEGGMAAERLAAGSARQAGPDGRWEEIPVDPKSFLTTLPATTPEVTISAREFRSPPALRGGFGLVELALNAGGESLTRDGISFAGSSANESREGVPGGANGITVTAAAPEPGFMDVAWAGPDGGATDPLYHTQWYCGVFGSAGGGAATLTVSGLDPDIRYQIRILHAEPRDYSYGEMVGVTHSDGSSEATRLEFGPGGSGSEYALVTIRAAGATSVTYAMPLAAERGPSISGVIVERAR